VKWFDYAAPATLREAIGLLAAHPGAKPLAGGTDLLVQMRAGRVSPGLVVDIKHIEELNAIDCNASRGLTLGAAAPCYRIYRNAAVAKTYPALAEVAALIGGVQIQGRASIGGNLCNAAPSADSVPLLIALGARCRIAGPAGEREVAVEDFCTPDATCWRRANYWSRCASPPRRPARARATCASSRATRWTSRWRARVCRWWWRTAR
jgi:carbon-monoxide dehydrogenase medium subunit